jgi:hypothetical protein
VKIGPSSKGVRLTRRLDGNVANQVADVYVDGRYAGRWAPEPQQWGLFATESFDIPASLTRGKSQITIKNTFVSSASNFTEYYYWAYSSVHGQWQQTDRLDVGPDHAADEQAHNYAIMNSDFAGTTTREVLPATTNPAAVAATNDFLAHTLLQISFDGQQTVDVPVGQFFGSGLGKWRIRSLFTAVDGGQGGWMSSWWPMPYARSATITLINNSHTTIQSGTAQITSAPDAEWAAELAPGGHAGYFRATYHYGPATQGRDVNWLTAGGTGKFAGVFMTMDGTNPGLGRQFMEGDHRGYIDGSRTPQIQGTGTEDIGLGGWYFNQGMFTGPFSGDPWQQGAQYGCIANCTGEYRLWIPDSMTFTSSIKIGQEHGPTDNVPANYGTTAFWYSHPQPAGVRTDSLTVGNAASESAHHYTSGALCTPQVVTNTYEGDDGPYEGLPPVDYTKAVSPMTRPVSFRLKINPDNEGVVLERTSDQVYGYQAAEVYVNGADAGNWQQPHANPYHNWLDDSFELPASLTRGYPELGIRLVHVPGSFAWTAASYRAVSLAGGMGLPPGQGVTRRPSFQPPTSSCSAAIGSASPGTAAAGQVVTITGTGFGASQGSGYVVLTDNGSRWGMAAAYPFLTGYTGIAPGDAGGITVDSWSNTQITFTLPSPRGGYHLWAGTPASAMVVNGSGIVSNAKTIEITPASSMSGYSRR